MAHIEDGNFGTGLYPKVYGVYFYNSNVNIL